MKQAIFTRIRQDGGELVEAKAPRERLFFSWCVGLQCGPALLGIVCVFEEGGVPESRTY